MDIIEIRDNSGPETRLVGRIESGRTTTPAEPTPDWTAKITGAIAKTRGSGRGDHNGTSSRKALSDGKCLN